MARLHLIELEDQAWLPRVLRDAGTAFLEHMARLAGHGERLLPLAERALDASGRERIVDLCSGGGGAVLALRRALAAHGRDVEVVLTDRFPNRAAFARAESAAPGRVRGAPQPIDARAVTGAPRGLRTLLNALHHFRPEDARRILADAAARGEPILVFEAVRRHPLALLGMLLVVPVFVLALVPFLRPFDWRWIPLTYLLPAIPFLVVWDGFVSCLRVYSPAELRALVAGIDAEGYAWEIGDIDIGSPVAGTYLLGAPDRA